MNQKETVVVDTGERRSSNVGVGIAVAALVLVILFFLFGGFNLFTGSGGGSTTTNNAPTTNVETPTTTAP